MQQSKKSKFRWVKALVVAVLVPGLGVPITKFVESYYNVSVFSSAIGGLSSWVRNVGGWFARDVTLPFWLVLLLLILVTLLTLPLLALICLRLKKVIPTSAPLTDDQNLVFVVVGNAIQEGQQLGFDEIRQRSGLSIIAAQNAIEALESMQLIHAARDSFGFIYPNLTPMGREHFLELEALGKP